MRVVIKPTALLGAREKARLDCLITSTLYAYTFGIKWADADWKVMVWEDEDLVSNVDIVERKALVGGTPVKLGGIGGVATKDEWRKRGIARYALREAQAFLHEPLGAEFGLLTCIEKMVPFYTRLGWNQVAASMLVEQPAGKISFPHPVMILPVWKETWPEGEIDLCGLPW
jgi:aminoglycoside 2'-N-acetyltransferase I